MAQSLSKVPWEPATTFWEALQALWLNHMLVMTDENYPGAGVSSADLISISGRIINVQFMKVWTECLPKNSEMFLGSRQYCL